MSTVVADVLESVSFRAGLKMYAARVGTFLNITAEVEAIRGDTSFRKLDA